MAYSFAEGTACWGFIADPCFFERNRIIRNGIRCPRERGGMHMNIGFIGAGKVGFTMGKFLTAHQMKVSGYYSRTSASAKEAAEFTETRHYDSLEELISDSDALFLTVPDDAIAHVWEQIRKLPLQKKLICHFSGALSSEVFSGIEHTGAYGYSIHPLFAVHDKYESYKKISEAFFTIEGNEERIDEIRQLLESLGLRTNTIQAADKVLYHAAAAVVSNLYVGLVHMGESMLTSCGFTEQDAHDALSPLIAGNAANVVSKGTIMALTGPIERNDVETVQAHLASMTHDFRSIYRRLSRQVLAVAKMKNPENDYTQMESILR